MTIDTNKGVVHEKTVPHIYCIIALIGILLGCTKQTEPTEWAITPAPACSITVGQKADTLVSFSVIAWGSNGCTSFSHFVQSDSGKNIYIKLYGKSDAHAVCTDVLTSFTALISVIIAHPDTFTFHFWKSEASSIDTTIVVP